MNAQAPTTVFLQDYTAPDFFIRETALHFELFSDFTRVHAKLQIERNGQHNRPLVLQGVELELLSLALNGTILDDAHYSLADETLQLEVAGEKFSLALVTRIYPQSNTSLEGLYRSRAMYCTQCEAQGFRKITYFLDRPDVLSVYTVTVEADLQQFPVLLANGNCIDRGALPGGRHFATWHDPFPKPSYLFALVAGDLACVRDSFVTASARQVALEIYVEPKDTDKCDHALASLKKAMAWDEQVYGLEYDLDVYMIVAVDDFNMGAMENKGLNIFNTSCVLASPATTTDQGYQRVEGVIAHEYFHNWSGNRVTCRDWFQLSLKEGFTVFRDEEFSADVGSRTVKRVEDVQVLRSLQFAEDAGPMAHPVRPASYIEISNFYTLTVYEKGAEVVRMIRTLIGAAAFRKGSDLYFANYDGQAATIEDFVGAMAEASGYDFSQFMHWYSQAGTPRLGVAGVYDAKQQTFTLTFQQNSPSTPEATAAEKQPLVIPIALGLVGANGVLPLQTDCPQFKAHCATHGVFTLTEAEASVTFTRVKEPPVPALLRDFSAPVKLHYPYSETDLLRLMSHDEDGFCRWDAAEQLAIQTIKKLMENPTTDTVSSLAAGYRHLLSQSDLDPAMVALMLELPSVSYLGEQFDVVDVERLHRVRETLQHTLAHGLEAELWQTYQQSQAALAPRSGFSAEVIALRSIKNRCLQYLMRLDSDVYLTACQQQLASSQVMSDEAAAFTALVHSAQPHLATLREQAIADFYQRWAHEPLVVNQWFAVQAAATAPGALARVEALLNHPAYDSHNPNKIRSLIGVFCNQNLVNFHSIDGTGYEFLADQILYLNAKNPQIAARLVTPLSKWQRYDATRQALMKSALQRLAAQPNLSKDVYEMVSKSLHV